MSILAQASADASNLTCQYTAERNKAQVANFYSILEGSSEYSDNDFTPDSTSLAWNELGEFPTNKNLQTAQW